VCRELRDGRVLVETVLGALHGRAAGAVQPGQRCVIAVRPENVALGAGGENAFAGKVVLTSYLGNTLRYAVETEGGLLVKVDVRDPWHHEPLSAGTRVTGSFPASTALTLTDD
jgi:spermidine/putrescine transport system ATP-binding protein